MKVLHSGKAKTVYELDEDHALMEFNDSVSVLDRVINTPIPGKGAAMSRVAAFWFKKVDKAGIPHHFVREAGPSRLVVDRLALDSHASERILIPLEVITRHYVVGSFGEDVATGRVRAEDLGFPRGYAPEHGERLPKPHVQFTTKREARDRLLSEKEALQIAKLDPERLEEIKSLALRVDEVIAKHVASVGLIHADGKKEFGVNEAGGIILADTFGTPDEDRWWDKEAYDARGATVDVSKEIVRAYFRARGFRLSLYQSDMTGVDAPRPDVSPHFAAVMGNMYATFCERVTGGLPPTGSPE